MEPKQGMTIENKIKYSDYIARICMFGSVLFIGYGAVVHMMTGDPAANLIMETGLVFVALLGLSVYTKKTLEKRIEGGKTFYQPR